MFVFVILSSSGNSSLTLVFLSLLCRHAGQIRPGGPGGPGGPRGPRGPGGPLAQEGPENLKDHKSGF